jgi:hypothetical protein
MHREFAASVKNKGVGPLLATREESIAMHLVLSGMFDQKIDEIKDLTEKLSKHEYAIHTVTAVQGMKEEAEAFSCQAVADTQEAAKTLKDAKVEARGIIDGATKQAQEAVNARAATLANTEKDAKVILDNAEASAKEIRNIGQSAAEHAAEEATAAKAVLEDYEARIAIANKSLSDINKTVEGEKARLVRLFDK